MSDSNLQEAADILYIISENYTIGNTHTPLCKTLMYLLGVRDSSIIDLIFGHNIEMQTQNLDSKIL